MKLIDLKTFPSKTENKLRLIEYGLLKKKNDNNSDDNIDNEFNYEIINLTLDSSVMSNFGTSNKSNITLIYNNLEKGSREWKVWLKMNLIHIGSEIALNQPPKQMTMLAPIISSINAQEKNYLFSSFALAKPETGKYVFSSTFNITFTIGENANFYIVDINGLIPKDDSEIDITVSWVSEE